MLSDVIAMFGTISVKTAAGSGCTCYQLALKQQTLIAKHITDMPFFKLNYVLQYLLTKLAGSAGVARQGSPSIISRLKILHQPAASTSHIRRLWDKYRKINIFYFHSSCTRNGDDFILLIKKGNAHKERMLSQAVINTVISLYSRGMRSQKALNV